MNTSIKTHYQDEQVARDYDQERFKSLTGRTFDRLEKRTLSRVLRRIRKTISQPRTLDVPCGTGRITQLWLQEGLQVVGGDISEAMISVARERCAPFTNRIQFRQLDLDALDLPNASFDLVSCIRLFHHLRTEERSPILKELARVTSRYVVVNVSYSSSFYRFRRIVKRCLRQGVSKTSSTWKEIQSEADSAGLRIAGCRMVLPFASEDMILLLEKKQ